MPGRVLHSILASIIAAGNRTGGIVSAGADFTRLFRRYELSTPRFIVKLTRFAAHRVSRIERSRERAIVGESFLIFHARSDRRA